MANLNDVAADAAIAAVASLAGIKASRAQAPQNPFNRNETCRSRRQTDGTGIVLESVWVAVGFVVFIALVWRKAGVPSAPCLMSVQKKSAMS